MKNYKFQWIYKWESKTTEIISNQSGAELIIQDGSAHESATMLENNIQADLGSISMAPKMSRYFKIDTYSDLWSLTVMVKHGYRKAIPKHHGTMTSGIQPEWIKYLQLGFQVPFS